MRLDIGCGSVPKGDVNLDLHVDNKKRVHLIPEKTVNLVCGDAEHLPFKDKTFSEVYSRHTLEHVNNPCQVIREMKRVTKHTVKVITPYSFSYDYTGSMRRRGDHKHWFFRGWFRQQGFTTKVRVKFLPLMPFGRRVPIFVPQFTILAEFTR